MTDYNKLVKALRHCATRSNGCVTCAGCPMSSENGDVIECINALHKDAAAAIEALQAEVERLQVDVDAVPVVHGHWVTNTVRGDYVPCCSECGLGNGTLYEYDYCPHCGAKMKGEANE